MPASSTEGIVSITHALDATFQSKYSASKYAYNNNNDEEENDSDLTDSWTDSILSNDVSV